MRAVTVEYEQRLWDELNTLLAEAVPEDATEDEAQDVILLAIRGHDTEIYELYERVKRLAKSEGGYLRDRMKEDNPITRAQKRLYGRYA